MNPDGGGDGGSALTWDRVRTWRAAPLETAGNDLRSGADGLLRLADELAAMGTPAQWSGDAAQAAGKKRQVLTDLLEDVVTEVSAARRAMYESSDGVRTVEQAVRIAEGFATSMGLSISADGVVTDIVGASMVLPSQAEAAAVRSARQQLVDECVYLIGQALTKAQAADADLTGLLSAITSGKLAALDAFTLDAAAKDGDAYGALHLQPPGGPDGKGDTGQNAAWWNALNPQEKDRVLAEYPEWIGNRDGVDFTYRDKANQALLPKYKADVQARIDAIEAEGASLRPNDPADATRIQQLSDEYHQLQDKKASLDTLEQTMKKPDRHLLGLDLSHTRAQAVISVGDVSTADHVAVFTPGLTSTVQGIDGYDTNMADLRDRTASTLRHHYSTDSVATVTWLGYQAPQLDTVLTDNSVASSNAAQSGGRDLSEFYRGVDASRTAAGGTAPDLTALGHSYGSTTTGYALRENTGVDRAAFFGSPGISVDRADQLHIPSGTAFYEEARFDPVADLSRFGTDPSSMYGMNQMWTGTATAPDGASLGEVKDAHLDPVTGHTSYLQDQSTSQYNLAAVVAGHPEDAIPNPEPDPFLHQ